MIDWLEEQCLPDKVVIAGAEYWILPPMYPVPPSRWAKIRRWFRGLFPRPGDATPILLEIDHPEYVEIDTLLFNQKTGNVWIVTDKSKNRIAKKKIPI